MKIIQTCARVFPFHGYGGREKYIYYLSKYLIKEGIDVEIFTSLDKGKKRTEVYDGIKYTFIPPMTYWRGAPIPLFWLYSVNLARYLKKEKPDILHCYDAGPYPYLHLKNRAQTIMQPFGMEVFTDPRFNAARGLTGIIRERVIKPRWKYLITHADKVAAEGDFQVELMRNFGISKEKIFNLPPGIDLDSIKEVLERETYHEELKLNDDDFVMISVNRFSPEKGIKYLIDAFKIIKSEIQNAKIVIIGAVEADRGEVNEYQNILNQVKTLDLNLQDDVILLTNISEQLLYKYYKVSDIYVSPTLQDDWIMGIAEAMAFGLPIVSTGQNFLVNSGVNGYVVPKKNPQALAEGVLKIYESDKGKIMGKKSQEMAASYDWRIIAKKAIHEYEKLINAK
jgi:glycosyltransferase involved in cell wall biosynthesis